MSGFILTRLKEKFSTSEEQTEGFPDMNYVIGNSSALDIGEVPTPLDERIGYAAQIGGSLIEVKVSNPATFQIERDDMISAISQLDVRINLHSDMNVGYTSAYKSRGQALGYDIVHDYFTRYMQEVASFKEEVYNRGDNGPLFEIGRINPHISTSQMPALNERMAQDVGLDPFGFEINDYDENARKQRNRKKQNIYKNPEFLRRLYYTLFLEVSNYPFQQYQTFASYSTKFDEEWLKARHMAANNMLEKEADSLEEVYDTIQSTLTQDRGVQRRWQEVIDDQDFEGEITGYRAEWERDEEGIPSFQEPVREEIDSFEGVLELFGVSPDLGNIFQLFRLAEEIGPEDLIQDAGPNDRFSSQLLEVIESEVDRQEIQDFVDAVRDFIEKSLNTLWEGKTAHPEDQYISQDAKWSALQRHLDVQEIRIFENAYRLGKRELDESIEKLAERVFAGDPEGEGLFDPSDREYLSDPEEMHDDMLERIMTGQQFQREMWKESRIFYYIIPAWMATSNWDGHEAHPGWRSPKFIWEVLIEEKWGEKDDVDLDLTDPRNGEDDKQRYHDLLENSQEFREDVAAAVGACYFWGHFTQKESEFQKDEVSGNEKTLVEEDYDEYTWIEWMNRYGIGVNMETMAGSSQQLFKVWRPKDVAVAAHAVNLTARRKLDENGELGGRDNIHPQLDGRPAKFTIDMEHVASLGADPWKQMKIFFEKEKKLAEEYEELALDTDKPISKILRQYHLMDPGVESEQGTYHGAVDRGNKMIYRWLYGLVEQGFARNPEEVASVLFELAEHKGETSYMMRVMMNMIELGIEPEEVKAENVDPGKEEYDDEREALIARFFGMDRSNYEKEWAKIEEHAFDPLEGLLEAKGFDYTHSGQAALEEGEARPNEWKEEEYR